MKSVVFCMLVLLNSCAPKVTPIKGTYQDKPFEATSNNTVEAVWDKIIDFFAQKGLSIKVIDRSSGLIISDKHKMVWSRENKAGELIRKEAWVVIERVYDVGTRKTVDPTYVSGEWNIRIKKTADGKTNINVNLVNIEAFLSSSTQTSYVPRSLYLDAKSTGAFEKMIYEIIQ